MLPALGGLALACARTGNVADVDWVLDQVRAFRATVASRFLYAQLLVEAAEALAIIGRTEDARRLRDSALDLSQRYRFHELAFRAEAIDLHPPAPTARAKSEYAPRVRGILRSVRGMDTVALPARARLAPASADGDV
jgi:hypothetical protein